jgi:TonB-linked SusC/RagA family outer membrane protein
MKNKPNRDILLRQNVKKIFLTMKISFLLIMLTMLNAYASNIFSQNARVSVDMQNATVREVVNEIERQGGINFLFNDNLAGLNQRVNVSFAEHPIQDVLDNALSQADMTYEEIKDNFIVLIAKADLSNQQTIRVTGKITDAMTREPLPGASVIIEGTTIGTVTGIDGDYSLLVPGPDAVITISYVGYISQRFVVGDRLVLDVSLNPDLAALEEIVIVGYGTQRKESLTGAISQITSEEILTTRTASMATAVQGKIPGLMIRQRSGQPGTYNSMISIRGFGTPLLVIDGVIRDGMSHFERLNPEDIESISVLKDASAAVYGMNADNGVIIVTTKSGTAGRTKINYNTTYNYKSPTNAGNLNTVDAYNYRVYKNEMRRNYRRPEYISAEELEKWRVGTEPGYQDFDWYNNVIQQGIGNWRHNFSISGGNDDITHYTSFSFLEDKGILKFNESNRYKRYNIRTAVDANLAPGLIFKAKLGGRYDQDIQPPQGFFWMFKQMYTSDRGVGPYTIASMNSDDKHYSVVPREGINVYAKMDPRGSGGDGYVDQKNYQYQLSGELEYKMPFIEGLQASVLGAYDGNFWDRIDLRGTHSLYDYMTDEKLNTTQASVRQRFSHFQRTYIQSRVSYQNTFADDHFVSALIVNELRQLSTRDLDGRRQYDQIFTHPILNQASTTNQVTGGGFSEEAFLSYIGRFNYAYQGKYLLELAFRRDGSYRYAPEQRWAFFPSGSIGWRISEESFMDNIPFIYNLKLRASHGSMGADAGNPFQYIPGYALTGLAQGAVLYPGNVTLGMRPPGVVNNNLTWIETTTSNIGIDVAVLQGQWSLMADVFQKTRTGLLATRATSVPNTFGASFPQENLNSDQQKGFEFEITHRSIRPGFSYGFSANLTYSRRYRLHVERAPYQSTWQIWKDGNNGDGRIEGRAWGYNADGIFTSLEEYETAPRIHGSLGNSMGLPGTQRVVDVNGDGIIDGNDQLPNRWQNDLNPPLQYGLTVFTSWKNFDFNMY